MQESLTLETLLARIKDKDDKVRCAAWQGAAAVGPAALAPLAEIASSAEMEVGRAANRAMWQVVRASGRPGAEPQRKAAVASLMELVGKDQLPIQFRRDVIWMLSEIVQDDEVDPAQAAQGLEQPELREDVRMVLERIAGKNATATLKAGLAIAADDYKPAIAASLRALGVEVPGIPDLKLKPTKSTAVKPVGR